MIWGCILITFGLLGFIRQRGLSFISEIGSLGVVRIVFGSPDGISQLMSEIHKHLFLHRGPLAFISYSDWVSSADFSNMAHFAETVTSLVSVKAIFSIVVDFVFSTTCAQFVWFVAFVFLSAVESC